MTINGTGSADAQAIAASLYAYGAGEATAATAGLALEEQSSRSREIERQARAAQREAAAERISEMRSEATAKMWQGVVQSIGQMAQGALNIGAGCDGLSRLDGTAEGQAQASAASNKWSGAGQGFGGLATGAAAIIGADAAEHAARAEEARQRESMHQSQADTMGDDLDRANRLVDKAFGHVEQIAQARMDARLRASRG